MRSRRPSHVSHCMTGVGGLWRMSLSACCHRRPCWCTSGTNIGLLALTLRGWRSGPKRFAPLDPSLARIVSSSPISSDLPACAFDRDGAVLDTLHVEVVSSKLGGEDASLRFLRAILDELTSEKGAMAFLPRARTSYSVREVHRPPSLLLQYFFLINYAGSILEAFHHILRNPHRVLQDAEEVVSVTNVSEITPDVMLQLIQADAKFDRTSGAPRLLAASSGVWFRLPQESFDSAENRFVKAVADEISHACDAVLDAAWMRAQEDPAVQRRRELLLQLRSHARQFSRAPTFDSVGRMYQVPVSSRVLQRRLGYLELSSFWQHFLRANDPFWNRLQQAIDLRDIATLYEYWVWFSLCGVIQQSFDCDAPEIEGITSLDSGLAWGVKARFPGMGTLIYNATRKTYSGLHLRPDFLWESVTGSKVGFDAKFRLAWDPKPLDVEADDSQDPVARAKKDDLVKMHAYRDAIPGLRAAIVVYPGHVARFRSTDGTDRSEISVAGVIANELNGVGAIPMTPLGGQHE